MLFRRTLKNPELQRQGVVRGQSRRQRDDGAERAAPPSEVGEVIADELRNPAIREGDILVPLVGRRLIARVASGDDVGAFLSPTVVLIRPDPVTIDPWFLAGFLSSSEGERRAVRMSSTLGEHIRFDPRRVRIPLLPVGMQRVYGDAFRRLWEFAQALRGAHDQGVSLIRDMIDTTASSVTVTVGHEESPYSVPHR